jgi:CelD/BcsL family acetyltransferase involved in cellulose biosynthesis
MSWQLMPASPVDSWAARWRQLHLRAGAPVLLDADFVAPLLAQFGSGAELLACYEQAGQTLAMAIVVPRGRAAWATFQPAQAPVGCWLSAPGLDLAPLLRTLLRALPGPALLLSLTQCDPALLPRPRAGRELDTFDYIDTARITMAGGFTQFWAARGKNLRANLKKQRARLDKEGLAVRLDVRRDAADMAAAVADYGRLESAGWKAVGGTAVHPDNAQGRFYRAMLEALCRRGGGSVYRYYIGEQLVAMDLCVEDAGAIVVLKTSYDERVAHGLSPALLMREEACQALFGAARLPRIEFYGKVMEWHLRWTDEVRTMYHINYYRWPALRRLHGWWRDRHAVQTDGAPAQKPLTEQA